MIDQHVVFEIHRLHHEGYSNRKIADLVGIHRDTISRYLKDPNPASKKRKKRGSKLDSYTEQIDQLLTDFPSISAVLVLQKLQAAGFDGEITIVRNYLRKKRGKKKARRPNAAPNASTTTRGSIAVRIVTIRYSRYSKKNRKRRDLAMKMS